MIENVSGKSSKSTVYNRLQNMVDEGLLVQKNKKGYYYPAELQEVYVNIPKALLIHIKKELEITSNKETLKKEIAKYV